MGDPQGLTYRTSFGGSSNQQEPYILSLDVGTTTIRAHVYDCMANVLGSASDGVSLLHPHPGWVEMDEDVLWNQVQNVIRKAMQDAGVTASQITCMGITAQRNTFMLWDKKTGTPYHHFITWQDLRASDTVKSWNNSLTMKVFNHGSTLLYWLTWRKLFLASSVLQFTSTQVTMRLKWVFDANPELLKKAGQGQVCYGLIDTWLLWKLTNGKQFATEYSFASSTGMYDPFQMEWSTIVSGLVKIPMEILPPVKDTSGLFGYCDEELFGARIPITAMVADQQASMFGQGCFNVGDIKCSMGTGTFLDLNTGSQPHASIAGLYPLIGWKFGSQTAFIAEGLSNDTGRCVDWAKSLGLFSDVSETSEIAQSVSDSDGVYFVPSFSGLQAPINDDHACCALMGIKPTTSKQHIVRSLLESLVFRSKLLHDTMLNETKIKSSQTIKVDGGVCKNQFMMQLLADLTGCDLVRPANMEMSSLGAAYLAGLGAGIWKNKEELKSLHKVAEIFRPSNTNRKEIYKPVFHEWERAVKRTLGWHINVFE